MITRCRVLWITGLWVGTIFLVQGCATTQQSTTLQQSMFALEQRVQALEQQVRGTPGKTGGAQSLADLAAKIEALEIEVGRLKGQIEEQNRRFTKIGVSPLQTGQAGKPTISSPATSSAITTPVRKPAAPEDPEKALYSKALQAFREGNYDGARQEFEKFLQKYPASKLADNALYWIGESYYSQHEYRQAVESYQSVLDRYPHGNKVPAALLREGDAFQKLGDKTAARILYQRVQENYPDTPQAQIAAEKLKSL